MRIQTDIISIRMLILHYYLHLAEIILIIYSADVTTCTFLYDILESIQLNEFFLQGAYLPWVALDLPPLYWPFEVPWKM